MGKDEPWHWQSSKVDCMEHFAKSEVTLHNTPSHIRKKKTKQVNPQLLPTCIQTQKGMWIITIDMPYVNLPYSCKELYCYASKAASGETPQETARSHWHQV
jgi:hypothetical protein